MVEILHGLIAEDFRRTDGNMRIAGEITINLKSVEKGGQYQMHSIILPGAVVNGINQHR